MRFHYHVCPDPLCGHIWSHDRDKIPDGAFRLAHTCPRCRKGEDFWAKQTIREALDYRIHARKMHG